MEDAGFESRHGEELFSKVFRPALGPTQPPIQWVSAFVPGGKAAGACSRQLTPIWYRG